MSEPLKINVHVEEKRYQPTQEKTVIPGWDAKTVTPDKGYALSKVTVEGMPEPTERETFTENGTYDVGRIGTAVVDVEVNLQDKTVTPTKQTQTVEADAGYDGLDTVTVNPIPPEYVVPSGSVDITENGTVSVSGKATANVNVPQGVFPSGTKLITENVTGEDVTNYAAVDVAVPGPSGTKQISITQNGTTTEDVSEYAEAEITVNTLPEKGLVFEDYDADGYPHSARFVGQGALPAQYCRGIFASDAIGLRISDFDIDDRITSINDAAFISCTDMPDVILPPNLTKLGTSVFSTCINFKHITFNDKVETIGSTCFFGCQFLNADTGTTLPATLTSLGSQAFFNNVRCSSFVFLGQCPNIPSGCFRLCNAVTLYDFSNCTAIPSLFSVDSLGHASGCVIRIPAALSDTTLGEGNGWESATNWSALTNIVWEVV